MITFQAKLSKAEVQFDDAVIEFLVRYYIETPDLKRKDMSMVARALTILEAFRTLDRLESEAAKKEIEESLIDDLSDRPRQTFEDDGNVG